MAKPNSAITENNIQQAREFLQKQFKHHSWWPTEQPGLAKHELDLMHGSVETLGIWCNKWLNSSQLNQLEKYCEQKNNRASIF